MGKWLGCEVLERVTCKIGQDMKIGFEFSFDSISGRQDSNGGSIC